MIFSDPVIKTSCLAVLEKQVNALLGLDPVTLKRLSKHFGRVVEFHCNEPDFHCYAHLLDKEVRLAGHFEGCPDACFSGSSVSYSILATQRNKSFDDIAGLTVSGDKALIKDLEFIHQDMEPDWEKPIVNTLGNVAGHALAQGLRFTGQQLNKVKNTFEQNCAEYLQEELRLIPSRVEIEGFAVEVQKLKEAVDQLEERIETINTQQQEQ